MKKKSLVNEVSGVMGALMLLAFVVALGGCAHQGGNLSMKAPDEKSPQWVRAMACADPSHQVLCGVGIAQGIDNLALAQDTADARAESKLAEQFKVYVARLEKDYMENAGAGQGMDTRQDEQMVTDTMKSFVKETLPGATIVEHYRGTDGTLYAKCVLDMAVIKKTLSDSRAMSPEMKKALQKDADKAFEELNREESSHR